ncbi:Ni/Fe-hydrogenase, b-type cytochrome subunit [Denitratisoma sp. DHT3]|uniref:Ni/Fe-hydrogenase, b-type cytochrome subunit n=1 Tax=Denitratisoma sp. DHT3 TaxID=1981880 RepID=UPI00119841B2|nr:Ni/Fe-hydrogenase, b-type cytochrome subunit [Denitratisoma sp. DHT3]QDX80326.1 Ni/Fe-hydrogenase, b-type cytochrome subunit [Denitratisoma sp. DHT3]
MKHYIPYHQLPDEGIPPPVTIYGPGVRLWHWCSGLLVLVLFLTGYFIGVPPPSALGDTSTLYLMGWIRFLHLASGYLFTLLALARLWLTFVEKGISHHLYLPAVWRAEWFDGFMRQVKWNLLMDVTPVRYVGLNPLGSIAMLFLYVLPGALIIVTGFAMYAEVTGHDSWQYLLFGWVTAIFGNTMDLHVIHRLAMWCMAGFVCVHVYIAVREDVLSRQTMISSMLSGERQFRR